jgi:hypothetical protein
LRKSTVRPPEWNPRDVTKADPARNPSCGRFEHQSKSDDAVAGYASLHHILMLEPDIIKLDISLTRDIGRNENRIRAV